MKSFGLISANGLCSLSKISQLCDIFKFIIYVTFLVLNLAKPNFKIAIIGYEPSVENTSDLSLVQSKWPGAPSWLNLYSTHFLISRS